MPVIDSSVFFAITEFNIMYGILFTVCSAFSIYTFLSAKKAKRRHALMSATRTSLVHDLKKGPAEVAGRAIAKAQALSSPWSNRKCVYYRFHVEQYRRRQNGRGRWRTYIDDTSSSSFLVADETGEIEILVSEGEMDLQMDRNSESGFINDASSQLRNLLKSKYGKDTQGLIFNKTLRYTETFLEPGDKIYVFGQASQADDGRWVMRHGEMPLIVSESGELVVQEETRENSQLGVVTIGSAIIAVGALVAWVFSKI